MGCEIRRALPSVGERCVGEIRGAQYLPESLTEAQRRRQASGVSWADGTTLWKQKIGTGVASGWWVAFIF